MVPRGIELTAGTLVQDSAHGVWSDGETIWVAHETDAKLYAYDLATGAAQADDDITPHSDSNSVPPADYSDVDVRPVGRRYAPLDRDGDLPRNNQYRRRGRVHSIPEIRRCVPLK